MGCSGDQGGRETRRAELERRNGAHFLFVSYEDTQNVFENFMPERETASSEEGVYDWSSILPLCYADLYFSWAPNLLREEVSDSFLRPYNPNISLSLCLKLLTIEAQQRS